MKLKSSSGIAMKLICCTALVLLSTVVAFSQTPKSGALLSITSDDNSVNLKIYDSQIHTGNVRTNSCDQIPTDAYVLQGGAPTGCDPGDAFETNSGAGVTGTATLGNFTISTNYICASSTGCGGTDQVKCNDSGSVCIGGGTNPSVDTGFLTVKNNGAGFTGTITLAGKSGTDVGFCSPGNTAITDSFTGTLAAGASRTFALAQDSSNCGGFNQSQTGTLGAGGSLTFLVGPDSYEIDGANNAGNESIKFSIVPVLQSSNTLLFPDVFKVGNVFPNDNCTPLASFSAPGNPGNPVCVEVQLDCTGNDCNTFANEQAWHLATLFNNDSLPGTPVFLKTDSACPPPLGFDQNIFLSYNPNVDPLPKGGTGGNSCFVFGYVNGTNPTSSTVFLPGYASKFFSPVANPPVVNNVNAGNAIPFIWQEFDATTNTLVTNPKDFFTGGFCTTLGTTGCLPNSVAVQFVQTPCPTGAAIDIESAGSSGLQFNSKTNTFQINAKTLRSFAGTCAVGEVIVTGSVQGLQATYTALFKFK